MPVLSPPVPAHPVRAASPKSCAANGCTANMAAGTNLIVAPLWVSFEANLGTLLRTCDAIGACMAVRATDHYRKALDHGDTLAQRPHIH